MKLVGALTATVFVIAVFVALLLTNARLAATQPSVYEYSFGQYGVVNETQVERADLDRAAREMIAYLGSGHVADLVIDVAVAGDPQSLLNEREILHMRDVRDLFQSSFKVQELALIYIVGYVGVVAVRRRQRAVAHVARLVLGAGGLTVGILAAAAIAILIGFHWLFTQFHLLSFSNDFWRLDPRTDRLIQMFPDGFWFEVTLAVSLVTLAESALLMIAAYLLLRNQKDLTAARILS
jgi:integral membrane protein (TIGR01906 family)